MKTKTNLLLAATLSITMYACYPGGADYVHELDTSISKFDSKYFTPDNDLTGKTYSLPEEILYVKNGEENEEPNRKHDEAILSQMRTELDHLGMTEAVTDTSIAVAITIIEQNNSGVIWVPGGGWWGGYYPPYPGWGWGGYYPWYPAYYNFKTGSIIIEMGDYENRNMIEETIPLIYGGALDGLLQGSDSNIGARIENGIDELFNQAPFN